MALKACSNGDQAKIRVNDPETSKEMCEFSSKAVDDITSDIESGIIPDS